MVQIMCVEVVVLLTEPENKPKVWLFGWNEADGFLLVEEPQVSCRWLTGQLHLHLVTLVLGLLHCQLPLNVLC